MRLTRRQPGIGWESADREVQLLWLPLGWVMLCSSELPSAMDRKECCAACGREQPWLEPFPSLVLQCVFTVSRSGQCNWGRTVTGSKNASEGSTCVVAGKKETCSGLTCTTLVAQKWEGRIAP
eukprot:4132990-Amphidinium_carterae.1